VSISGPQGSWRGFSKHTEDGRRNGVRQPEVVTERSRSIGTCVGRAPDPRMEYEDSIPMERRPTLPVMEILAAERQERSWESTAVPGRWGHPSVADRGRGIGDLGMAGLNIGAPTRL
jgi:hypothetical protein